jgi:threonine dehydrogenase-like Zn-dependent dehydrogenase
MLAVAKDAAALRAATPGGQGADAWIDFTSHLIPHGSYLQAGFQAMASGGRISLMGTPMAPGDFPYVSAAEHCFQSDG